MKKQNNTKKRGGARRLLAMASQLVSRIGLSNRLGNQTFQGHRKLYDVLGYPITISFEDMYSTYKRENIAKRLVAFPAQESWKSPPEIRDGDGNFKEAKTDTAFVKEWSKLVKRLRIYHYLYRIDKLTGIGQYGVLFLGARDGGGFDKPVSAANDLLYLQPYMQTSATVERYDENGQSPRFGLPEFYKIDFSRNSESSGTSPTPSKMLTQQAVHWSRVLHVAEDLDESEVFGTPRLESVYNLLLDVLKASGGAAESYWLIANRGMQIDVKDGYNLDVEAEEELEDEIEEYVHGLRRIMRTSGVDITELGGQTVDPRGIIWSLIALIAGAKGWPQRILIGSERGELASTTDQALWAGVVAARQHQFCEPSILRPLIDWSILHGVVSPPSSGEYVIDWPSIYQQSELERATVLKTQVGALKLSTSKPVGEIVTEDEVRSQLPWAEGEWKDAAKGAYGDDFFDKKAEREQAMLDGIRQKDQEDEQDKNDQQGQGKQEIPETQAVRTHSHDYQLVEVRCPFDGCGSYLSRLYPDHGGLLVCHECELTFDPTFEIKTITQDDLTIK